ncbi:MAG: acyl carrier protein [Polyangiaceae bacterium]|nr:acyl carrier protein [Polyangiaceae bacterium]
MDRARLLDELRTLIVEELELRDVAPADLAEDAPLFGGELALDSLDALQLVVAVEERWGVRIPEGDEAREILRSLRTLSEFVAAQSP